MHVDHVMQPVLFMRCDHFAYQDYTRDINPSIHRRTYNATVNHLREILGTTSGHPGSYNDKTTILYNEFIMDIKSGAILDDYEFELLERRDGKVIAVKYRGVWVVVDNGYHNWSVTVPPFTNSNRYDEIRWSEWIERDFTILGVR